MLNVSATAQQPDISRKRGNYDLLDNLTPHDPIVITSNASFGDYATLEGWPGNGSESSPYIIENLYIRGNGTETGITIQNTQVYFYIRNVLIENVNTGFYFDHVLNGAVENCTIRDITNIGIYVYYSINSTMQDSIITNVTNDGIKLSHSENNFVYNNSISGGRRGIKLELSANHNIVQSNIVSNIKYGGIYISASSYNTIINNHVIACDDGVYLLSSPLNTIANNTLLDNDYGIYFSSSSNNLVDNNIAYNNSVAGIYMSNSYLNNITSNAVNDSYDGFQLYNADNNLLFNNTVNNSFNHGFFLTQSEECNFTQNSASYGLSGYYLDLTSTNNIFIENEAYYFEKGFFLEDCTGNQFMSNIAELNENGFFISGAENNYFENNVALTNTVRNSYIDTISGPNTFVNNLWKPSITVSPLNLSVTIGETFTLYWLAEDENPTTCDIYKNGQYVSTEQWNNSFGVTFTGAFDEAGLHNVTVYFNDNSGLVTEGIVWIDVRPSEPIEPPVFTSTPSDYTYEEGTTGNVLSWIATDPAPDVYDLYIDEAWIVTNTWASGVPISIDIDGLAVGSHNITIVIYNVAGGHATDQVTVIVEPQAAPTFTSTPSDITFTEGAVDKSLSWIAQDLSPAEYFIYINSTLAISDTWVSDEPIVFVLDAFEVGTYNVTIVVFDALGLSASDSVTVIVLEASSTTSPTSTHSATEPASLSANITVITFVLMTIGIVYDRRKKR